MINDILHAIDTAPVDDIIPWLIIAFVVMLIIIMLSDMLIRSQKRAVAEQKAQEPVNGMAWMQYDNDRIRAEAEEIRRIMKERR
jgi:large-conductance mechanosensitive channel